MLCPEIWNFPAPKIISSYKKSQSIESVSKVIELNNFYKSVIVTCPDEINTPSAIEEALLGDSDYYKISNCALMDFLDPVFINSFVKGGKLYCISTDNNCMTQDSAAITPDGVLTVHIQQHIYQTLGLEGTKCPHNYYQIQINLTDLKHVDKIRQGLSKLGSFNFYVSWYPNKEDVCPSSIAKYFCDRDFDVSCHSLEVQRVTPDIEEIPGIHESEIEEVVEWVGMLANGAELSPTEDFISSYSVPESDAPLKSTRISLFIVKGFITPNILQNTCELLSEYVESRELPNYWVAISIQSIEESLWQWNFSSTRVFQSHNSSCNIFFMKEGHSIYSIGQLKYS